MKENMSFIAKIKTSMFSIKDYSLLLKESFSKTLIYSLVLSLIVGILIGVTQLTIITVLEKSSREVLSSENFEFEINNGILNLKQSTYKKEEGSSIILFDSTKSMDESELVRNIVVHKDMSAVFFNDGIIARNNGNEYKLKYTEIPFMSNHIDNEVLLSIVDKVAVLKYFIFLPTIFTTYLLFLINALVVSVAGILAVRMQRVKIAYADILKLSIFAMTLPTILGLIIPLRYFSVLIGAMYLVFSINYIRDQKNV
ncbi:hypothetical protein JCM1393_11760 [Clostridium carnis]